MQRARMERLSDLMITEISRILLRKVKDPRVQHVTITDVRVSPDLKSAQVFFSVLLDELDKTEIARGLNHAAGFIRSELFQRLRIKSVPTLSFRLDPSITYGARIEALLHALHEGREENEEQ